MDRASLRRLQLIKLSQVIDLAVARAPLYQTLWSAAGVHPDDIRSIESFQASIPLLTKADLCDYRDAHDDPFCGLLCAPTTRIGCIGTTSGTTSEPMPLVEVIDGLPPFPATVRDLWGAGLRPGDYVVPVMAVQRGPQERTYQQLGCTPLLLDLRLDPDWDEVFDVFRRYQPASIYLLGPMVAELDRISKERDLAEIFSCLKFAVFSGEPLGARMRQKMTGAWGLELYEVTGTADTGVAWDCRMHDGFHIWEDHVLAECIDPLTGEPVPDGEVGELVCTSLSNPVWPLIRHRSGDLVRLDTAPCGCGRTHQRFHLVGRISDQLEIDGIAVLPGQVWSAIEQVDETAAAVFQIVHPAPTSGLYVRVGYDRRTTDDVEELRVRLAVAIAAAVGIEPTLELLPEAELLARRQSGIKLPRVVRS
jgi:phenylacetate-CoA ligase